MSLASDYAARATTAATSVATATASAPAPFTGPGGASRAEVAPNGNMRLLPGQGGAPIEIPPGAALALRDWITLTFG